MRAGVRGVSKRIMIKRLGGKSNIESDALTQYISRHTSTCESLIIVLGTPSSQLCELSVLGGFAALIIRGIRESAACRDRLGPLDLLGLPSRFSCSRR